MSENNKVYKSTITDKTEKEIENKEIKGSILQKIGNSIINKPFKKIYRIGLFILVILAVNNTNSNNISDLLSNTLRQNICQNFTEIHGAIY